MIRLWALISVLLLVQSFLSSPVSVATSINDDEKYLRIIIDGESDSTVGSAAANADVDRTDGVPINGAGSTEEAELGAFPQSVLGSVDAGDGLLVLDEDNFRHAFLDSDDEHPVNDSGPRLILLVLYDPQCHACDVALADARNASLLLKDNFRSNWEMDEGLRCLPPVVAKMDGSAVSDSWREQFEPLVGYPAMKFVMSRGTGVLETLEEEEASEGRATDDGAVFDVGLSLLMWDYVGPREGGVDIYRRVMHHWYRSVVTARLAERYMPTIGGTGMRGGISDPMEEAGGKKGLNSVFALGSYKALMAFLKRQGSELLRPVTPDLPHFQKKDREYALSLLDPPKEEPGLAEPFTVFVQCRLINSTAGGNQKNKEYGTFNKLAQAFVHRTDVAFFVILSETDRNCAAGEESDVADLHLFTDKSGVQVDGAVSLLRLQPFLGSQSSGIDWENIVVGGATYIPDDTLVKSTDPTMTQFVVKESTPTLLWFTRDTTAPLAFPQYRSTHAVLFVDMHHIDETDPKSEFVTSSNRRAVASFRKSALRNRRIRPVDDVVFLIVPSTEIRVMTTFGIDIWTELDRQTFSAADNRGDDGERMSDEEKQCIPDDLILPTMLITNQTETTMRRYYLSADRILTDPEEGQMVGTVDQFLDDFFLQKLRPVILSQPVPKNRTNTAGVQTITGDTFNSVVMERPNHHTLIFFFAPTCGHSKRFSVIWNELARLIRHLKWDHFIDVIKMDLTQNEVPHDVVDVRDFPSVYYFPPGSKHAPTPLVVEGDDELQEHNLGGISNTYDIVEWLIRMGRLDEEELLQLAKGEGEEVKKSNLPHDQ